MIAVRDLPRITAESNPSITGLLIQKPQYEYDDSLRLQLKYQTY